MATPSTILAWKIPWTEESGRLQSLGFQSIRHDRVTEHAHTHVFFLSFFFFTCMFSNGLPRWLIAGERELIPWSRKWQIPPVTLPGKFHGQRSLADYSPWGHRVRHDWATKRACVHAHVCVHTHTHTNTCLLILNKSFYQQELLEIFKCMI